MTRVRVLIVEDERIAADAMRNLLTRDPNVDVVGTATDGRTAVMEIRDLRPDIVFLDIQIPELDGFGVIDEIGVDHMPLVVFVTAYDRFSLRAFEVHALDYLLKPFDEARFFAALDRAKRELHNRAHTHPRQLSGLLETVSQQRMLRRFPIKSGGKIVFLQVDEIDYLEAAGNYVRLHVGNQEYLTRETVSAFEARLCDSAFVRIHRSVIVNRRRIKELKPWFTGEYAVILVTGKELTLSRGYRDRLPQLLAAD